MSGATPMDPSTLDPVRWTLLAVGALLGAAGVYALWRARPARPEPGWRLPGVGELSTTTITVVGLACLVAGYLGVCCAVTLFSLVLASRRFRREVAAPAMTASPTTDGGTL